MKITITVSSLTKELTLTLENTHEAELLIDFARVINPLIATLRKDLDYKHPRLKVKKESDKCPNTHKP